MAAEGRGGGAVPYSRKVEEVEKEAERVTKLYGMGRWAAVAAITWASAGLLGAYATKLGGWEMGGVLMLVVLTMAPLYAADAFSRLLTAPFPALSQEPSRLAVRPDQDPRPSQTTRLRRISSAVGFLLCASTFAISSFFFLFSLRLRPRHVAHHHNLLNFNLYWGLLAFYTLCIVHAAFLALATFSSASAAARFSSHPDRSLLRYYDHLLAEAFKRRSAISGFLPHPPSFFRFAYEELLGGDCRRNVQPRNLASQYKHLLQHLYEAERQGTKLVRYYLGMKADTAVQQAAANVVGLWMSEDMGLGIITDARSLSQVMTTEMVEALLEKVGGGQVGWAATNSLAAMAMNPTARSLLRHLNLQQNVGDKLVKVTDPGSNRSLVVVRAIVHLVHGQIEDIDVDGGGDEDAFDIDVDGGGDEDAAIRRIFSDGEIVEKLKKDLRTLMASASIHRIRVLAAYLYALLGCDPSDWLLDIQPAAFDSYWLLSEAEMLRQLYSRFPKGAAGRDLPNPKEIRVDRPLSTPKSWRQITQEEAGSRGNGGS